MKTGTPGKVDRRRWQSVALVGGAGGALLLLASALHDVVLQPGRPLRFDLGFSMGGSTTRILEPVSLPAWFPIVAAAGIVLFVLGLIFSRALRRDLKRNLPIYALLLFGLYLLGRNLRRNGAPPPQPGAANVPGNELTFMTTPAVPDFVNQPPEWMVIAVTAVIVAGVLGVLYVLMRRLRQPKQPLARLVEEAREALAELQSGSDLRDTITRCYADMVRIFSEQRGMGRDKTMTPREFEQRLAAAGLGDMHIQRLTRLFELVRYSQRMPGEREEREAQECLAAIVQSHTKLQESARVARPGASG